MAALDAYAKAHPDAAAKLEEVAQAQRKALQDASTPGLTACQNDIGVMTANEKPL